MKIASKKSLMNNITSKYNLFYVESQEYFSLVQAYPCFGYGSFVSFNFPTLDSLCFSCYSTPDNRNNCYESLCFNQVIRFEGSCKYVDFILIHGIGIMLVYFC